MVQDPVGTGSGQGLRMPDFSGPLRNAEAGIARAEHLLDHWRPLLDAYRPHDAPNNFVRRDMMPHLIGRAFEVGAMRGHPHGEPHEPPRILREGRLIIAEPREAAAENRTGEAHQAGELRQAGEMRDLSLFEKIFMAHFEGGIPVGERLENGQFRFLAKSEKGWVEFFQKFLAFTMDRKGNLNNVQALVVRGLLKTVLVSDLKFADGKTDKFVRLLIHNPEVMQKIASMAPGEVISHDLLMQWAEAFGGPEFIYQALSHRVVNPEAAGGALAAQASQSQIAQAYRTPEEMKAAAIREGVRDATQGIALSARTEQAVAERLDIRLDRLAASRGTALAGAREGSQDPDAMKGAAAQLGGLFLKKRKRGMFDWLNGDPTGGGVFVPWYQHIFRTQKVKGKPRWWVPLVYFVAVSAACFGLLYLFRYWIS